MTTEEMTDKIVAVLKVSGKRAKARNKVGFTRIYVKNFPRYWPKDHGSFDILPSGEIDYKRLKSNPVSIREIVECAISDMEEDDRGDSRACVTAERHAGIPWA